MAKVQLRNEIVFKAPTRIGLLADVAEALAAAGVDIEAIGAYDKGDKGEFLLVTSDNRATGAALAGLGGEIDMVPVVTVEVPDERGALARLARLISDAGLNIGQVHATTGGAGDVLVVLRTDEEARVVDLLAGL